MKFHPEWIVWILACISFVLCQDGIDIVDATKSSLLSEVSKLRDFEATSSQRPTLTAREEQIEDELINSATTTETLLEKRKFTIRPLIENEGHREIVTNFDRFDGTGPTTTRSVSSTSINKNKVSFSSTFKKYDGPENVTNVDNVNFTTSFDGLTKKSTTDNGERKTRQRLDGFKGVTTNRGKTRFQNEQTTSEIPDLLATLRHKKPIRVKPIEQIIKEDVVSALNADDLVDTTTVIQDTTEVEQQRPKFKKPPLIATHHPNFGTSTETSRRPAIRSNLNLKQKISSSTIKTRPPESDATESDNTSGNKSLDIISSNVQSNKIRPVKVITPKGTTTVQQPIPPTATAWALASLKAPNNTNKLFRKPANVTNAQEQIAKIKPFITWSTRLQKINEENSNTTSISNNTVVTESKEFTTGIPVQNMSSINDSSTANRLTPQITSTESLLQIISTSPKNHVPQGIDSTATIVGGDTDQNKYEVYGSLKPDVENAKTVIETLRPSSSTTPSESQSSNLLLVTSYKSILENNNTSGIQQNVFTSSENPIMENILKKEIIKDNLLTMTTNQPSIVQLSEEVPITGSAEDHTMPIVSTSTEMISKIPGLLFDYSEYHDVNKEPTITTTGVQPSSSDVTFSFSHDIDLSNRNHSTTTEQYIESIKTKLDGKITKSTNTHDSLEIDDFTHMFSLNRPISSSSDGTKIVPPISEKTISELPLPTNEISNTSQVYSWSNGPDTFFTDFDSNSTDSHDNTDDGQKTFESSSQSSIAVNELTSESDISENDVPIIITSSSTTTTSTLPTTTTTTIILKPTMRTTTTSTTPIPISTTTSTTPIPITTTTTSTTPIPITTTTTLRPSSTTTTITQKPTTTTTISPSTTTTTTPRLTTTTTTTSTTPIPEITTATQKPTATNNPILITTTTNKPNPITSRPKPAVVDLTSTTLEPNIPAVQSFLKVIVNSTMKNICGSEDELKDAIIKLFESGTESVRTKNQIRFLNVNERKCLDPNDEKSPVSVEFYLVNDDGNFNAYINEEFINLLDKHEFDYKLNVIGVELMQRIIENVNNNEKETQNSRVKAAIYLSCIAGICSVLVFILLVVRKRQKRFNYGQRCTPVSLDDYSMDNISVYNSVRRKGVLRASKRSYGNPAFDDSSAVSHSLNFGGLISFSEDRPAIDEEFSNIPVITVKPDELPPGAETKNRYANVIPMPETRVMLNPRGSGHNSDYINANFVKGYKGADKFYIACQAPMQSTLPDFWQMIWEQNTRVIMMVTSLTEKGVERCADYLPPSEVVDCHRLFGDYQVTLKKREVKDKLIISNLQLKNLETNLWRDVTHLWYGGWPVQGVPSDPGTILAFLMEARSHMKTNSGPHVVHCSPGTGRTGTLIACDIAIREFELSRSVDVPKTVYAIRRCRAGAVQTRDQYALIYKVINLYASKLSGGVLDSI